MFIKLLVILVAIKLYVRHYIFTPKQKQKVHSRFEIDRDCYNHDMRYFELYPVKKLLAPNEDRGKLMLKTENFNCNH